MRWTMGTSKLNGISDRPDVLLAIMLMLMSGLMASGVHVLVRFVSHELHVTVIVVLRAAITVLVTLPFLIRQGRVAMLSARFDLQALRGLVTAGGIITWYYALTMLPLADAGVLNFTTNIFVTIGAALVFGEVVGIRRWAAIGLGLFGAMIVLKPGAEIISVGALLALASSALWATSLLMAKRLAAYDRSLTISFYQPLMLLPFAILAAIPFWSWPTSQGWLVLIAMGILAAVGNLSYIHALRLAQASILMPIDYVRLLWMVMWGYVLFGEIPGLSTWAGAALIISATLFITWRESQLARRSTDAKKD